MTKDLSHLNNYVGVSSWYCPETNPFAYLNGTYCCDSAYEGFNAFEGEMCDGGPISINSACCKAGVFKCTAKICRDSKGIV